MRRIPLTAAGAVAAALALLATAVPAHGQDVVGEGLQVEPFGAFGTIAGEVFQWDETGFGGGALARYRWPSGLSAGIGGRYTLPTADLPDGTSQEYDVFEAFAEVRYSPLNTGVFRPFVAARGGYIDLQREVTLPPDVPIFGPRPAFQRPGEGNAVFYGGAVGSEFWLSDQVAVRVAGTGSLFSVSGFEARVDEEGADPSSESLGFELGASIFLGRSVDSDGDGVRDGLDECPDTPSTVVVIDEDGCPVDSDRDGVADYLDSCDNSPAGVPVGDSGCPLDDDEDGVWNDRDQCPDTPARAVVDGEGCPSDADGDGVYDGIDECSSTREGVPVDERGCILDEDGDGVPDPSDECAATPEDIDPDEAGCTRIQRALGEGGVVLQGDLFAEGTAELTREAMDRLYEVAQALAARPGLQVEVQAHTSAEGSAENNRVLSQRRAEIAVRYMVDLFPELESDRLTPRGYGESRPLDEGGGEEAAARNERLEVVVTSGGGDTAGESGTGR